MSPIRPMEHVLSDKISTVITATTSWLSRKITYIKNNTEDFTRKLNAATGIIVTSGFALGYFTGQKVSFIETAIDLVPHYAHALAGKGHLVKYKKFFLGYNAVRLASMAVNWYNHDSTFPFTGEYPFRHET